MNTDILIGNIKEFVVNPIITLLFAVAVAVFLWGAVEFIRSAASDEGREKGKQHLLWGVIGMFIMVTVYAIMAVIETTFGI